MAAEEKVPDTVVPMYSKALLPHRITAARFADAMRELRDGLKGSLRDGGAIARIALIFERFMWVIAKGDDFETVVAPTATELALALDELDDEIAALAARPTSAGDNERMAQLECNLAEAQTALESLRTELAALVARERETESTLTAERDSRAAERAAAGLRIEELQRELGTERVAREAAERIRLDEFQRALAAVREEHASATQAIAQLTDLASKAGTAHTAIGDVLRTTIAAAQSSGAPNLAATRAALDARKRTLDVWLRTITDTIRQATEEIADLDDEEQVLTATLRASGDHTEAHRQIAAIAARRERLDAHSNALVTLKSPIEAERTRIAERIRAIELVAEPIPERAVLPTIPEYPAPPDSSEIPAPPAAGPAEDANDGNVADAAAGALAVQIAIVLYDIVAREIGPEARTILWIGKSADAAGILQRHRLNLWSFNKPVLSDDHKGVGERYLKFWGVPGGSSNKSNTMFARTAEPVPLGWEQLVTNDERARFITAFRERIAARAAAVAIMRKAAKTDGSSD